MDYLTIKNWKKFQHYQDRNPPWIKLHFELLSSADWVMLDDASRVLAIACMLISSKSEGKVPFNPEYIKRVAYLNTIPNFIPLVECGFLEDASNCLQMLADARPEKEKEKEAETDISVTRKRFTPPTVEEVTAYCHERQNNINAQNFMDHYIANGWKVGKVPMKNWQAAIRKWEKNDFQQKPTVQRADENKDYLEGLR
jgi:hypothetical protein